MTERQRERILRHFGCLLAADYDYPTVARTQEELTAFKLLERRGLVEHQGERWRRTETGEVFLGKLS